MERNRSISSYLSFLFISLRSLCSLAHSHFYHCLFRTSSNHPKWCNALIYAAKFSSIPHILTSLSDHVFPIRARLAHASNKQTTTKWIAFSVQISSPPIFSTADFRCSRSLADGLIKSDRTKLLCALTPYVYDVNLNCFGPLLFSYMRIGFFSHWCLLLAGWLSGWLLHMAVGAASNWLSH